MRALIVCGIVVLASLTPAIASPHAKHGSDAACDAKCAGKVPGQKMRGRRERKEREVAILARVQHP
jgi:hypothetical protein